MKQLLYFYAVWCPPCRFYDTAVIKPLAERMDRGMIRRINADTSPQEVEKYGIDKLPAIVILDEENNVVLNRYGSLSLDKLEGILDL